MRSYYKYLINSVLFILFSLSCYAQQTHYFSDYFQGGVTGGGTIQQISFLQDKLT